MTVLGACELEPFIPLPYVKGLLKNDMDVLLAGARVPIWYRFFEPQPCDDATAFLAVW